MSFEIIDRHGEHEEVIFCRNKSTGLRAIIAIHNTVLGPALGGLRMWNYASEEEALVDVLRLSRGMTYKAAASGLNLGGGKAVIIGDPKSVKSEGLFRTFGTYVNALQGRYITAEDVGTTVEDMEYIFMETPYVTGISRSLGGSGDPSPYTAYGVFMGMKAALEVKLKTSSFKGVRVAIQGVGHVGSHLIEYLLKAGAEVVVGDISQERIKTMKDQFPSINVVDPKDILQQECEIIAPCAMGGVINDKVLPKLKCQIVAGAANNQLENTKHGRELHERGILYAPDYLINSGGLINVFVELEGYSFERAKNKTKMVYTNTANVFRLAEQKSISPHEAAVEIADNRIAQMSHLRTTYHGRILRPFSHLKGMKSRQK